MRTLAKLAIAAALPLVGAAGCKDFLTGDKVGNNPNTPTSVNRDLLFTGVQAQQFVLQEGQAARIANMWVNAMAGTDRQFLTSDDYDITEDEFTTEWALIYPGGGLLDIRKIIDEAEEVGATAYAGVAKVWEAITLGTATSLWGDIPFSAAFDPSAPATLDDQASVYAAIQSILDDAISDLQTGTGGPGGVDLVYGGNTAKWIAAAYTLKARYYMHTVKVDPSAAANALAATMNGIADPANDFLMRHTAAAGEENGWYQFAWRERTGYISAGKTLVDLMISRGDPRLTDYFAPNDSGIIKGSPQATACADCSNLAPFGRGSAAFDQPLVTADENDLLQAEAAYRTGAEPLARTALNRVKARYGLPLVPNTLTGGALLEEIYEEAYVSLFQNIEEWNWYKRSCYPNLAPSSGTYIPRRVYYSVDERNANPNIPAPDTPGNDKTENPVDPGLAVTPYNGAACLGQANTP